MTLREPARVALRSVALSALLLSACAPIDEASAPDEAPARDVATLIRALPSWVNSKFHALRQGLTRSARARLLRRAAQALQPSP